MNMQRSNKTTATISRNGNCINGPLPPQDTTIRDDACLLAAFANIATKTVTEKEPNTHTFTRQNIKPTLPQKYCAIQPRPRTVSDSSTNDSISSGTINPTMSPPKTRPVEIRPNQTDLMNTERFVYRTILKKKFSWRNFPILEKFLIANREEYLRHSTLNYTIQQKQYNNHLTRQMIELAAQNNIVFDDDEFSFVTIRDRIRCYYKSYVQSLKKKGVLLGYAARKAGLVTDNDIELSASTAGKIYVPKV